MDNDKRMVNKSKYCLKIKGVMNECIFGNT